MPGLPHRKDGEDPDQGSEEDGQDSRLNGGFHMGFCEKSLDAEWTIPKNGWFKTNVCIYIYIYGVINMTHTHTHTCVYIYIYTQLEFWLIYGNMHFEIGIHVWTLYAVPFPTIFLHAGQSQCLLLMCQWAIPTWMFKDDDDDEPMNSMIFLGYSIFNQTHNIYISYIYIHHMYIYYIYIYHIYILYIMYIYYVYIHIYYVYIYIMYVYIYIYILYYIYYIYFIIFNIYYIYYIYYIYTSHSINIVGVRSAIFSHGVFLKWGLLLCYIRYTAGGCPVAQEPKRKPTGNLFKRRSHGETVGSNLPSGKLTVCYGKSPFTIVNQRTQ